MTIEQKIEECKKAITAIKEGLKTENVSPAERVYAKSYIDYFKLEIQRLEL